MKKMTNRVLLITGISLGVILVANGFCLADNFHENKTVDIDVAFNASELFGLVEEPSVNTETYIKIYNTSNELVYESCDRLDKKLELLLERSDYLTEVSDNLYYRLSR